MPEAMGYATKRAATTANADKPVNTSPVAWINARCVAALTNQSDPS
jgi:hypothetical protein